jgi:hypothetical protein
MTKQEEKIRKQAAKEIFALASRIKKRDNWFIGGYLGTVMGEWEEREAKNAKPKTPNYIVWNVQGNA